MPTKTVLITGCSAGGIGSALAVAFAKQGCKVFATARNVSKMAHLQGNPQISTLQLDPTSAESVETCVKMVESEIANDSSLADGKLDILINNAGQSTNAPILDVDIEAAKAMYDINVWGCVRVTQKFSHMVIKAKGTIVFTSTVGSTARFPFLAMYSSSKYALNQISDTLRMELEPFGVKVVSLMTGAIESEISKKESVTEWRLPETSLYKSIEGEITKLYQGTDLGYMKADEYADYVAKKVLGGAKRQIWKGRYSTVTWIMVKFLPRWLVDMITKANSGINKLQT